MDSTQTCDGRFHITEALRLPSMSRPSSSPTNLYRSQSPVSVAASDTTYHSLLDVEPFETASPATALRDAPVKRERREPKPIVRHDSGYESNYSGSSHGYRSKAVTCELSQTRHRKRPVLQRASRSMSSSYSGRHSGNLPQTIMPKQKKTHSYYCFPASEAITSHHDDPEESARAYHPPPQTTHYWMSDQTRRLEYAAIDAASRGFKGWVMKRVPNCFVPKENRRLTFDDDTGSVRRYRLELECDDYSIKESKRSKKWGRLFGR